VEESSDLNIRRQAISDAEATRKYQASPKIMKTERLSPRVRADITEMANLLDRWKFAGAVLLSEAIKLHNMTGCCRFEGLDNPIYCMGMNAIVQSIQRYIRETEEILDAHPK
jgi:hypothetical protein